MNKNLSIKYIGILVSINYNALISDIDKIINLLKSIIYIKN